MYTPTTHLVCFILFNILYRTVKSTHIPFVQDRITNPCPSHEKDVILGIDRTRDSSEKILLLAYITGTAQAHIPTVDYKRPGSMISGSLTYAINLVNTLRERFNSSERQRLGLPEPPLPEGYKLDFCYLETYGNESESIRAVTSFVERVRVAGFIGPQESCDVEAAIASTYNVPMISHYCDDVSLRSKLFGRQRPVFLRTRPQPYDIAAALLTLLEHYNWDKVAYLTTKSKEYAFTAEVIRSTIVRHGIEILYSNAFPHPQLYGLGPNHFRPMVQQSHKRVRIYIVIGDMYDSICLLETLRETGLLKNGDYFVIGIDKRAHDASAMHIWSDLDTPTFSFSTDGQYDPLRPAASCIETDPDCYRAYMQLTHTPPRNEKCAQLKEYNNCYLQKVPFNLTLSSTRFRLEPEAGYLVDAIWLYALAAGEILQTGGTIADASNGDRISERLINRRYVSSLGYINEITERGDAQGNYTVIMGLAAQPGVADHRLSSCVSATINDHSLEWYRENTPLLPEDCIPTSRPSGSSKPTRLSNKSLEKYSKAHSPNNSRPHIIFSPVGMFYPIIEEDEKSMVERKRKSVILPDGSPLGKEGLGRFTPSVPFDFPGSINLVNELGEKRKRYVFSVLAGREINWIGGQPPLAEPMCGFDNQKCKQVPSKALEISLSCVFAVLIVSLIGGIFVYRDHRFEKELERLSWKIDYRDIVLRTRTSHVNPLPLMSEIHVNNPRLSVVTAISGVDSLDIGSATVENDFPPISFHLPDHNFLTTAAHRRSERRRYTLCTTSAFDEHLDHLRTHTAITDVTSNSLAPDTNNIHPSDHKLDEELNKELEKMGDGKYKHSSTPDLQSMSSCSILQEDWSDFANRRGHDMHTVAVGHSEMLGGWNTSSDALVENGQAVHKRERKSFLTHFDPFHRRHPPRSGDSVNVFTSGMTSTAGPADGIGGAAWSGIVLERTNRTSAATSRWYHPATVIGCYRKQTVVVHRFNLRCTNINREVKRSLKLMRDISHKNLCTFIGASVEIDRVCTLWDYAPRGSLCDILQPDRPGLKSLFITSLTFDLIRGLTFLHDSDLRYHGNLKSSNCVVDSRWVLKLTDFGLTAFREGESFAHLDSDSYFNRLYWTPPEFLRRELARVLHSQHTRQTHPRLNDLAQQLQWQNITFALVPDSNVMSSECDDSIRKSAKVSAQTDINPTDENHGCGKEEAKVYSELQQLTTDEKSCEQVKNIREPSKESMPRLGCGLAHTRHWSLNTVPPIPELREPTSSPSMGEIHTPQQTTDVEGVEPSWRRFSKWQRVSGRSQSTQNDPTTKDHVRTKPNKTNSWSSAFLTKQHGEKTVGRGWRRSLTSSIRPPKRSRRMGGLFSLRIPPFIERHLFASGRTEERDALKPMDNRLLGSKAPPQKQVIYLPEVLNTIDFLQSADIFAFGMILFELHSRGDLFAGNRHRPQEIIRRAVVLNDQFKVPYRPNLSRLSREEKYITDCIEACWSEEPDDRPTIKQVASRLRPMSRGRHTNIMDHMMSLMEDYAHELEKLVSARSTELMEEKRRTEQLLYQMLPEPVAEQLKRGKAVEPEAFDNVTIYFSDICGFTEWSSSSSPFQVVNLLNELYTRFDAVLSSYDVYKVETIGDAYMVVSGLPKRNENHAGEIASMSLKLLSDTKQNFTLSLRIGIHSGPCAAGVVGTRMPRYCLFGDTVNTTSRMESHGVARRIHCSEQCKLELDKLGNYLLEERGLIAMKGKGVVRTYWLNNKTKPSIPKATRPSNDPFFMNAWQNVSKNFVQNQDVEIDNTGLDQIRHLDRDSNLLPRPGIRTNSISDRLARTNHTSLDVGEPNDLQRPLTGDTTDHVRQSWLCQAFRRSISPIAVFGSHKHPPTRSNESYKPSQAFQRYDNRSLQIRVGSSPYNKTHDGSRTGTNRRSQPQGHLSWTKEQRDDNKLRRSSDVYPAVWEFHSTPSLLDSPTSVKRKTVEGPISNALGSNTQIATTTLDVPLSAL